MKPFQKLTVGCACNFPKGTIAFHPLPSNKLTPSIPRHASQCHKWDQGFWVPWLRQKASDRWSCDLRGSETKNKRFSNKNNKQRVEERIRRWRDMNNNMHLVAYVLPVALGSGQFSKELLNQSRVKPHSPSSCMYIRKNICAIACYSHRFNENTALASAFYQRCLLDFTLHGFQQLQSSGPAPGW